MDADKTMIVLIVIAITILVIIKIYIVAELVILNNDYYILQQEKIALQRENIKLNVAYLQEASYGNLYWKAQREQGFRPITDTDYYLLK